MMRVLLSAAMILLIGAGARAPWRVPAEETGLLRLSWRLRGERVETCRTRTEAELAALPVHMRTPQVCEGGFVPYRLVVQIDDAQPDTVLLEPSGARGDRPVFVLEERELEQGPRRVRLHLQRSDRAGAALVLDTVIAARSRRVLLVTLEAAAGSFVTRSRALAP